MNCPKCKIEAVVVNSSLERRNGFIISILDVMCSRCRKRGHLEKVVGEENSDIMLKAKVESK